MSEKVTAIIPAKGMSNRLPSKNTLEFGESNLLVHKIRQLKQVEQFKKLEGRLLPMELDYETIQGLRLEARQKLNLVRPENLGQASRITGVSPADISVLLIYMEQMKRKH